MGINGSEAENNTSFDEKRKMFNSPQQENYSKSGKQKTNVGKLKDKNFSDDIQQKLNHQFTQKNYGVGKFGPKNQKKSVEENEKELGKCIDNLESNVSSLKEAYQNGNFAWLYDFMRKHEKDFDHTLELTKNIKTHKQETTNQNTQKDCNNNSDSPKLKEVDTKGDKQKNSSSSNENEDLQKGKAGVKEIKKIFEPKNNENPHEISFSQDQKVIKSITIPPPHPPPPPPLPLKNPDENNDNTLLEFSEKEVSELLGDCSLSIL